MKDKDAKIDPKVIVVDMIQYYGSTAVEFEEALRHYFVTLKRSPSTSEASAKLEAIAQRNPNLKALYLNSPVVLFVLPLDCLSSPDLAGMQDIQEARREYRKVIDTIFIRTARRSQQIPDYEPSAEEGSTDLVNVRVIKIPKKGQSPVCIEPDQPKHKRVGKHTVPSLLSFVFLDELETHKCSNKHCFSQFDCPCLHFSSNTKLCREVTSKFDIVSCIAMDGSVTGVSKATRLFHKFVYTVAFGEY